MTSTHHLSPNPSGSPSGPRTQPSENKHGDQLQSVASDWNRVELRDRKSFCTVGILGSFLLISRESSEEVKTVTYEEENNPGITVLCPAPESIISAEFRCTKEKTHA